jgi:hypothetical protein
MITIPSVTPAAFDDAEGIGTIINGIATRVTAQLAQLKRLLGPLEDVCIEPGFHLGVRDEWNIAADGLFGRTGVVGFIAGAMNISWADYSDAAWVGDHIAGTRASPREDPRGLPDH